LKGQKPLESKKGQGKKKRFGKKARKSPGGKGQKKKHGPAQPPQKKGIHSREKKKRVEEKTTRPAPKEKGAVHETGDCPKPTRKTSARGGLPEV